MTTQDKSTQAKQQARKGKGRDGGQFVSQGGPRAAAAAAPTINLSTQSSSPDASTVHSVSDAKERNKISLEVATDKHFDTLPDGLEWNNEERELVWESDDSGDLEIDVPIYHVFNHYQSFTVVRGGSGDGEGDASREGSGDGRAVREGAGSGQVRDVIDTFSYEPASGVGL